MKMKTTLASLGLHQGCGALLLLSLTACNEARSSSETRLATSSTVAAPSSAGKSEPAPNAVRAPIGDLDVTFAVVSDTHLGHPEAEAKNRALVASLGALTGLPYPGTKAGRVTNVRGLLIAGDLTEWGNTSEWEAFQEIYGIRRGGLGAPFPVFEVVGNHDKVHGPWLAAEVDRRHGGRGMYTWDWDDLHLVALGEAPEDESLAALGHDLALVHPDRPIVLFFHRPLAGPWSNDGHSFSEPSQKAKLRNLLQGRDVVAIFHGHHHATEHYLWEGIDVWKPGAVKDGAPKLAVVHVEQRKLTVATFDWQSRAFTDVFTKVRFKKTH